jgi:hypothetical protein
MYLMCNKRKVAHNQLSGCPDSMFVYLKNLLILYFSSNDRDLSHNQFTKIPFMINLNKLLTLYSFINDSNLNDNQLTYLPDSVSREQSRYTVTNFLK